MDRLSITDRQWSLMEPLCLGKVGDPGRSGANNRLFLEAILWIARTGSPWRDLPSDFGHWNTVFKRYRDWVKADVFKRIFDVVSGDPTWNMPALMPQSSKFTVTPFGDCLQSPAGQRDRAQKPSHRCKQRLPGNRGLKIRPSANPKAE